MVDVGAKTSTLRRATAEGRVYIPVALDKTSEESEWWSPKGPVFQTAVIAGIQGAKSTSTTIPLCHPLPITRCDVTVEPASAGEPGAGRSGREAAGEPGAGRSGTEAASEPGAGRSGTEAASNAAHGGDSRRAAGAGTEIVVRCTVETDAKTGVEMEALCGVSAACLTVYDMGKSVTHGITIGSIELVEKTGGKRDWHRDRPGENIDLKES